MALLNTILAQTPAVADTLAQQAANAIDTMTQQVAAVTDTLAQAAAPAATAAEPVVKELSVWELTQAGGWLMIPLALLLPALFTDPLDGVWWSIPVSDTLSAITAIIVLLSSRRKLHME